VWVHVWLDALRFMLAQPEEETRSICVESECSLSVREPFECAGVHGRGSLSTALL